MTRRRPALRALDPMALALLLVLGCGKDDGGGGGSNSFLFANNAQFNEGRTVRWAALPIRVFLGNGVASPGEVTAWTAATGGQVTFTFVGSAGAANISFAFRSDSAIAL